MGRNDTQEQAATPAGQGNDTIPHTDKDAPRTTRSDATDLGVPMRPLAEGEVPRQGPEDALGLEPTRGDYSDRLAGGPSVRMAPVPAGERDDQVVTGKVNGDKVEVREPGPNVRPVTQVGAPVVEEPHGEADAE